MISQFFTYLHYDFVQDALLAGTLSAVLGAVVGYFVVLRNVGFAAHALGHIGFAGAAGAGLLGLTPFEGMLLLTIGSGVFMGATGDKVHRSDLAIGMVLATALGLGRLFLNFHSDFAGQAIAILFGDIFGVSHTQLIQMLVLAVVSLLALSLFSRRLLFASTQPRLAEARGLRLSTLSVSFMVILAIAVSIASQVVGILLVFALVIAPAGIALRVCRTFWSGMICSITLGVVGVWLGILLACATDWPPTFCITALFFIIYAAVEFHARFVRRLDH